MVQIMTSRLLPDNLENYLKNHFWLKRKDGETLSHAPNVANPVPTSLKRVFKHCSIQSYPPEDSPDDMKPTVPELPENPPDILLENIIPSLGDQSSDIIPPSLHSSVSSVHLRNPIKSISGSEMKPEPEPGLENICSPELNENSTMLEQAQELLEMYPQSAARQALGSDPTQLPTGVNV